MKDAPDAGDKYTPIIIALLIVIPVFVIAYLQRGA